MISLFVVNYFIINWIYFFAAISKKKLFAVEKKWETEFWNTFKIIYQNFMKKKEIF